MYEIKVIELDKTEVLLRHNDDGSISSIPTDPANSDYQAYLESLKEVQADEAKTK